MKVPTSVGDDRLILAGIVLLAVGLRFVDIGSHLAIDDGYSYIVASAPDGHAFLARLAASENTPPLFYLLLAPLPLGHSAWLRVPAALPGVLMCVVLYFMLRPRLGARVALLAALAVAVSPFLVTYSNVARGFMLEDLALLIVLWSALKLGEGQSSRWWLAYTAAGIVAVYTEYDAAIFLLALTVTLLWLNAPARRQVVMFGALPLLTLIPWIPQIVRAQHAVNKTKLAPTFAGPSLTSLRDATVTLAFGENGGTSNSIARWLLLAAFLALAWLATIVIRRAARFSDALAHRTIVVLAGTSALTLIGHAIIGAAGIDVFNQRYLTLMIPLLATLGAAAIVYAERRALVAIAGALLAALGAVGLVRRYHHEFEPDLKPVRLAAIALHPRTILTNTPTVLYYLKALRPQLDRPFNLGSGRARSCARPCLVIDDALVHTGTPRQLAGTPIVIEGRFQLRLER